MLEKVEGFKTKSAIFEVKKSCVDFIKNNKLVLIVFVILIIMLYSTNLLKNERMTAVWFKLFEKFFSWPVAILVIFLKFEKPIIDLVPRVTRLKIGENEISFLEKLEKIEEELSNKVQVEDYDTVNEELRSDDYELLFYIDPKMAILRSWGEYEKLLRDKFEKLIDQNRINYQYPKGQFISVSQMMFQLSKSKLINSNLNSNSKELNHLRNLIAHGQDVDVSTEMALEYDRTLRKLKNYISSI
ncbi:hypothetical protein MP619_00340 [Streptococcus dysgalactiae]|uniref:RiboL-PSP-HEPN domain-containing protein n=1 Tax=Streptococcus dysgalactiae TaxID=1334 RepID=A0AAE9UM19_STRDY|nr:hypothetical protein [Streptococcus dysgalactiae]QGH04007.1 hypothetical protein EA458_05700 [Streptococcus dysgalactiae subsp. dysgalactiae]WAI93121.1 hypothetical protein MP619_00340 [Streptococcus dysgalactiae]WCE85376.1 hypothetical protein PMN45_08460 [Streptococcus dysgalactiae]WCN25375.1 hypothetical protein PP188_08470 [Streptococcus dysgalactiae]BBE39332.1 hypothetical protein FGCSD_0106 [Streptococcus dysgalactiae]